MSCLRALFWRQQAAVHHEFLNWAEVQNNPDRCSDFLELPMNLLLSGGPPWDDMGPPSVSPQKQCHRIQCHNKEPALPTKSEYVMPELKPHLGFACFVMPR